MPELASRVVEQAKSWIGHSESNGRYREIIDIYNKNTPLPRSYKVKYNDEWCATFVSACSIVAGTTNILPVECSCERMIELFKVIDSWVEDDNYTPKSGDAVFYDWDDNGAGDNTGWSEHVGIIESVYGNTITVIEGNNNGRVVRRTIYVNGRYIRGYGVPKYDNEHTINDMSVDRIANEVIAGKWDVGEARKTALTKAGYDYNIVQKRVNELLSNKGTVLKSNYVIAKEVIAGKWGVGEARKTALTKDGYDYKTIQSLVNKMLS